MLQFISELCLKNYIFSYVINQRCYVYNGPGVVVTVTASCKACRTRGSRSVVAAAKAPCRLIAASFSPFVDLTQQLNEMKCILI